MPSTHFSMSVDEVFNFPGRGIVVTGRIQSGTIKAGDALDLSAATGSSRTVTVQSLEMFDSTSDSASAGSDVGLVLEGIEEGDVRRGDLLQSVTGIGPQPGAQDGP